MDERRIGDLIEELKALKVRESIVLSQLEAATKNRTERTEGPSTPPNQQETRRHEEPVGDIGLLVGDRVYVINRVRKPATWTSKTAWVADKERHATVTHIKADQVHILTDNGVRTWRARNNLKRISEE